MVIVTTDIVMIAVITAMVWPMKAILTVKGEM